VKKLNGSTIITGLFAVVLCVLLSGADTLAQDFTNTGNMQNHGTIRLRTASASVINTGTLVNGTAATTGNVEFHAADQTLNNDNAVLFDQSFGVIVFNAAGARPIITSTAGTFTTASTSVLRFQGLIPTAHTVFTAVGVAPATRILGTTYYEYATVADQYVQGVYYEDLTLDDVSTKQVLDAVYVSGVYSNATSAARTYAGTFHYDGSLSQNLTPEAGSSGGTNIYAALDLINGPKVQVATETVNVGDALTSDAAGALTVNGTMRIGMDATPTASSLIGTLLVDGAGSAFEVQNTNMAFTGANLTLSNGGALNASFTMNGTGNVDLGGAIAVNTTGGSFVVTDNNTGILTVSGALTLDNAAIARMDLGIATQMDVTGSYANTYTTDYTNAQYDPTSLVRYLTAAQVIAATGSPSANQYGDLTTDNGVKTTAGNVYVEGDLIVGESVGLGGNLTVGAPASTNILYMTTPTSTITYDGGSEVVGALQRTVEVATTSYTMNNTETTIDFTAGSYAGYMEFNVQPATNPNMFDDETDVNRKITLDFDNQGWTGTIRAGYKAAEANLGTWLSTTTEATLRYWEASVANEQKVATSNPVTRSVVDPVRYIELAGITAATVQLPNVANLTDDIFASNDLLLRGGPTTFITVNHGRWSNPDTWDEGVQPSTTDNAVVRHNVWVGMFRDDMGEIGDRGKINEFTNPDATITGQRLATNVEIIDELATGSSIVFGYGIRTALAAGGEILATTLATLPYLFQTGATLTVTNSTTPTGFTLFNDATLESYRNGALNTETDYHGLILLGTNSVMRVNSLVNNGAVGVGGILEIGD
jgi:hypothetical protein